MDIFHTDTISIKDIDIEELIGQADLNKDGEVLYIININRQIMKNS